MDNRDLTFVRRYLDVQIEDFRNTVWNQLVGMIQPTEMALNEGFSYCPACGKFFSDVHVLDRPNYCENCGQAFEWPDEEDEL